MAIKNISFKNLLLFALGFILVLFIIYAIISWFNNNSNAMVKCNMKFGLCPAAKCVPTPYDDSKAFCMCDVVTGTNYSVGNNDCEKIKPYTSKSGQEIIFSDFSPIITKMGYHMTSCPPKATNMNCMNKVCSVDPNNPAKAICICDKLDNQGLDWVTFNKKGAKKTCNYQSGASKQGYLSMNAFIKQNP
uniref:Uncharacterized protein n=1 Tax=viral metagenome TaxID=1070528 RepID=A0A6C0LH50_9ZZZZ